MTSDVLQVDALDLEARGVARREGKVVFIEGALPTERVSVHTFRRKPSYEIARVEQIHRAAALRVEPRCPHFGVCGGCLMQHLFRFALLGSRRHRRRPLSRLLRINPMRQPQWVRFLPQ